MAAVDAFHAVVASAAAADAEFAGLMLRVVLVGAGMFIVAGGVLLMFIRALRASSDGKPQSHRKAMILMGILIAILLAFVLVLTWLAYRAA